MTESSSSALERQHWDFLRGVVGPEGLPEAARSEVAFAGRSNVGKSSLINALLGRNNLARTSNTPGRTQEINFFSPDGEAGPFLVDLPGYGYARASRTKVAAWTALLRDYLKGRPNLRRAFLLVDARHGIKPNDEEIMTMLDETAVSYQVVLTKIDKLSREAQTEIEGRTLTDLRPHVAAHPEVLLTSAAKGWGLEAVREEVSNLLF